jgi:hypothetical protein
MNTELDKLIGRLDKGCGQRVKAQASVQGFVDTLRMAGPIGMAIATAAMAILWSAQEGPKLVKALSDLMAGTPTPLTLPQEQLIQQAIATAQAKTVAEFRAGNQSDYGLSFTGTQNPVGDLGVQGFAEESTWRDAAGNLTMEWQIRNQWANSADNTRSHDPKDRCNYLRQDLADIRNQKELYSNLGDSAAGSFYSMLEQATIAAIARYCGDGPTPA